MWDIGSAGFLPPLNDTLPLGADEFSVEMHGMAIVHDASRLFRRSSNRLRSFDSGNQRYATDLHRRRTDRVMPLSRRYLRPYLLHYLDLCVHALAALSKLSFSGDILDTVSANTHTKCKSSTAQNIDCRSLFGEQRGITYGKNGDARP